MKRYEVVLVRRADDHLSSIYSRLGAGAKADLFYSQVLKQLSMLEKYPELGRPCHQNCRRLNIPDFPYAIFYRIHGNRIVVQGIVFLGLNTEELRRRLES
ncbi:MAG: type II toxin-antitoxin system RelE/ParE family toxin [Puniceicoccales bacterium]